ncbi:Uncharacterized protein APZ42_003569, partial [Daphnia magna]
NVTLPLSLSSCRLHDQGSITKQFLVLLLLTEDKQKVGMEVINQLAMEDTVSDTAHKPVAMGELQEVDMEVNPLAIKNQTVGDTEAED